MNDLQRYRPPDDEDNSFEYLPKPLNSFDLMPTFYYPKHETNQFDLDLARIQSDTFYSLARMRMDAQKTRALISSTETIMSQTLALHHSNGTSFRKLTVETKVGWIFKRSCKITIECEQAPINITTYRGWLK